MQLKEDLALSEAVELCRTSEMLKPQMVVQVPSSSLDAVTSKQKSEFKPQIHCNPQDRGKLQFTRSYFDSHIHQSKSAKKCS